MPGVSALSELRTDQQRKLKKAMELRTEERQRILGVMPNFNTSNAADAEPLTPGEKFNLAAKGVFDPFVFATAGIDAGLSQAHNDFREYRQGATGYSKRFGASYADTFTSTMVGSALLPVLLRQDPRYFRRGTGSFPSRVWYAALSSVLCKNDNGRIGFNYSNMIGNLTAGGVSNLYYPAKERGLSLTFDRAATLTAEGIIGNVFAEFWPDISRRIFSRRTHSSEIARR